MRRSSRSHPAASCLLGANLTSPRRGRSAEAWGSPHGWPVAMVQGEAAAPGACRSGPRAWCLRTAVRVVTGLHRAGTVSFPPSSSPVGMGNDVDSGVCDWHVGGQPRGHAGPQAMGRRQTRPPRRAGHVARSAHLRPPPPEEPRGLGSYGVPNPSGPPKHPGTGG